MSLKLPAKKPRIVKTYTDVKSISNESTLKRFMTKGITLTIKDEILLLSNKHLDFHSTREVKPTTYNDIPTLAEINARAT